jgi:hypothetical protein
VRCSRNHLCQEEKLQSLKENETVDEAWECLELARVICMLHLFSASSVIHTSSDERHLPDKLLELSDVYFSLGDIQSEVTGTNSQRTEKTRKK